MKGDIHPERCRLFISKNNPKFTVFIETPSKPFNSWTFPKVCELYGLSEDPNPNELETRIATIPSTYLPEKLVKGKNGRRNLDYGFESRTTGRTIGLIELSKPLFVAYEDDKAEKVLGHIIWLLEEAQKPVETSQESKYLHCIYSTSDSEDQINLTKSAIKKNPELLRSNVKMLCIIFACINKNFFLALRGPGNLCMNFFHVYNKIAKHISHIQKLTIYNNVQQKKIPRQCKKIKKG
ncbi:hypothetical protein GLOIN_2v1789859 [Rhizophagus irregularis DAOM 181602=DAOM 197198]|nr:hypothetical protein GLOIN_2v1789859 [Rhizophagus irregularis DAOM 181602=DAOM 197198]